MISDVYRTPWDRQTSRNQIHAMVRNRQSLFVYWEVGARHRSFACHHTSTAWADLDTALLVRNFSSLRDADMEPRDVFTLHVHPETDNWYLHDLKPSHVYMIDFGLQLQDGYFVPLLRSNAVTLPRVVDTAPHFVCFRNRRQIEYDMTSHKHSVGKNLDTEQHDQASTLDSLWEGMHC